MEIATAKQTLAAYLAGRPIADADLSAAHAALERDLDYCRFLRAELDPPMETPSLCEIFSERAAEFSELTPETQASEFPALAAHIAECAACQWLLQRLHTFPEEAAPSATSAQPVRRRASTALHVAVDRSGNLRLASPAPGFTETVEDVIPVGLLGGVDSLQRTGSTFAGQHRVWTIFDSQRGLEVDFTIAARDVDFALLIRLRPDRGSSRDWRLELTDADRLSYLATGAADDFRSSPVVLPPGIWLVVLQHDSAGDEWEVPLRLEFDADED